MLMMIQDVVSLQKEVIGSVFICASQSFKASMYPCCHASVFSAMRPTIFGVGAHYFRRWLIKMTDRQTLLGCIL